MALAQWLHEMAEHRARVRAMALYRASHTEMISSGDVHERSPELAH